MHDPSIEIWAGIECTVNRVGDLYFDQIVRSGHHEREDDIRRIADLGVTHVRYPVLWERTAPRGLSSAEWAWADRRLEALAARGLGTIVGLVHHGSGPRGTSVVDPAFADGLRGYARSVAARYPWIKRYTPVNEPLTTARFAALYGHWYPHRKDDASFCRALVTQCRATVLAMHAIREVRPDAELVPTEDLAFVQSTPALAYQAEFENERRWLSMELIMGRVVRAHRLRAWLVGCGIGEAELDWFTDHAIEPAMLGFNYYLTSERWLDEEVGRWPAWSHGDNGRMPYADVHAVMAGRMQGLEALLIQAWERFGVPLAVTEAHIGGSRDDQLRWLVDGYDATVRAKARGADIRAFTAWSAFGSFDWHCLVTRAEGVYEPGLFDIRGPRPRPTALARAVSALARGDRPAHPVLAGRRFWATRSDPS